jgi:hypothetical protein
MFDEKIDLVFKNYFFFVKGLKVFVTCSIQIKYSFAQPIITSFKIHYENNLKTYPFMAVPISPYKIDFFHTLIDFTISGKILIAHHRDQKC